MSIAFVPPWYGPSIPGGAEAELRRLAHHLRQSGLPVEVVTTCVKDFHADWSQNHHRPGMTVENGVPVHRFPVRPRKRDLFDAVNWKLMHNQRVTPEEEQIFVEESIRSPAMEEYITEHIDSHIFVFVTYMFGTTYWGVRASRGRALLIPCLHDEPYARMEVFRDMFQNVGLLILHSGAEQHLAQSLYEIAPSKCVLMGGGVDTDWTGDARAFQDKHNLMGPFILYAGRKEPGKNVYTLVDYFRRYRGSHSTDVNLVVIGSGRLEAVTRADRDIRDLGFVPKQDKYDAYAAATLLCQPSLHESFSLVIMEAWVAGTPVLVHGDCEVTKEHCIHSNGGLYFSSYAEFEAVLDLLLRDDLLRSKLGANGRRYVLQNYRWDIITERYRKLLESLEAI